MAQKQQAKYEGIAKALASRGRHGDSMMIHVSPDEVRYLEAIAPSLGVNLPGGRLPINPDTGQPEAFPFLLGLLGAIPAAVTSAVAAVPQMPLHTRDLNDCVAGKRLSEPLREYLGDLGGRTPHA